MSKPAVPHASPETGFTQRVGIYYADLDRRFVKLEETVEDIPAMQRTLEQFGVKLDDLAQQVAGQRKEARADNARHSDRIDALGNRIDALGNRIDALTARTATDNAKTRAEAREDNARLSDKIDENAKEQRRLTLAIIGTIIAAAAALAALQE